MHLIWKHIIIIFIVMFVYPSSRAHNIEWGHNMFRTNQGDWRVVEALAEEHPYIVALLSSMRDYICTGSIINKFCVVTAGNCISYDPKFIAVSTAIYNKKVNNNSIFQISYTLLHEDYTFDLKSADPNVTKMHSNIGLAFVSRPFLALFIYVADMGNTFAAELKGKSLTAIGYGNVGSSSMMGLQYQRYQQVPCMNPKWYYCVCGTESVKTYVTQFGIGGPVLLQSTVVGISSAPCGSLTLKSSKVNYNIFTVVGPYMPWITKNARVSVQRKALDVYTNSADNIKDTTFLKYFHLLIMISKVFF